VCSLVGYKYLTDPTPTNTYAGARRVFTTRECSQAGECVACAVPLVLFGPPPSWCALHLTRCVFCPADTFILCAHSSHPELLFSIMEHVAQLDVMQLLSDGWLKMVWQAMRMEDQLASMVGLQDARMLLLSISIGFFLLSLLTLWSGGVLVLLSSALTTGLTFFVFTSIPGLLQLASLPLSSSPCVCVCVCVCVLCVVWGCG
jgi:hypothetical protein